MLREAGVFPNRWAPRAGRARRVDVEVDPSRATVSPKRTDSFWMVTSSMGGLPTYVRAFPSYAGPKLGHNVRLG